MLRLPASLADEYRRSSPVFGSFHDREPNRCFSPDLEEAQFAARRRQLIRDLFPGVPEAERLFGDKIPKYIPPGVDMWKMYQEASTLSPQEWYEKVHNKGSWDFKQLDPRYQDFGNWAYAFSSSGISRGLMNRKVFLFGAGAAQFKAGTYTLEWCWSASFCDDPVDQKVINMGFDVIQDALRLLSPVSDIQTPMDSNLE
jgi:hypothetical protein